jgi:hypothetical protein
MAVTRIIPPNRGAMARDAPRLIAKSAYTRQLAVRMVASEQFLFSHRSKIATADRKLQLMPSTVQVGTILMKEWPGMPQLFGLEIEPCLGDWSLVKVLDGFALDRKIHAAGWNFFFMAAQVKAMFFGSQKASKVRRALKRILAKVKQQHFNSLEVTAIVSRHFLGVPYVTVSVHSRHIQQSCHLESAVKRQSFQRDSEWARE